MLFLQLAEVFEKLEKTTKRLEMFEILSQFFKKISKEEVDEVVYFCEEKLLPSFKGIEIGMAEKMIEKSIAKCSGKSASEVSKLYKKTGDLGIAAEKLSKKQRTLIKTKAPTIIEVYNTILKIAKTGGAGSVERKINMLAGLLSKVSAKEAKYIVRFVLGRLRLGIGDPTIMDSMSKAITGDRMKLRPDIERAYNLSSDLGLVADVLFKKGVKGLKTFKVQIGSPIRMALAERLPSASDIIKKIGKCAVETKYDGLRLQVHKKGDKIEIFSRNLEIMTPMFPDIVQGIKKQIRAKTAILEGEAVAFNEATGEFFPFQVTITRKRKYEIEKRAKEAPLVLFSFDILYINNKDMTQKSYSERTKILHRIIKKGFTIRIAEKILTNKPEELEKFFEENIQRGTEGIIAKRLGAEYQAGARNFNWIKLKRSYRGKLQDTVDVCIVGYFKGRGMRAKFGIGALLGCVYDKKKDMFKTIARIGSGLTEAKWQEIRKLLDKIKIEKKPVRVDSLTKPDVWTQPKYVFTVMADEITKSPMHTAGKTKDKPGYALRFPRIKSWIRDKKPEDSTSVKEIEKMFKMQKRVKTIRFVKGK
ncbi:MAG: ATP-dependent DNA ligase [Candidatus Pacearchaeota archaeon]|nr:MAG: ATP-dependent DNA ligase [Candidatus Pacearchaeota archaeon]